MNIRNEKGSILTEYGLLMLGIGIACIAVVAILGQGLLEMIQKMAGWLLY